MNAAALKHLSTVDPIMGRLIREIGACGLVPETRRPPFQSLVQAVAHQQLHGTAAANILKRFKKLFPGRRFPRAADLAGVTDEQLRACGLSFAKIKAIRSTKRKLSAEVHTPTPAPVAAAPVAAAPVAEVVAEVVAEAAPEVAPAAPAAEPVQA